MKTALVLGAGAIGTNHLELASSGASTFSSSITAGGKIRTSYNLSSLHFNPTQLEKEIKKHFEDFKIIYKTDERDRLAKGWPQSINDTHARNDWGWEPNFNLSQMVNDIILNLTNRYKKEKI